MRLLSFENPLFFSFKQIIDFALKIATSIASREDFVDGGGPMSYGPDRADAYRHAAR